MKNVKPNCQNDEILDSELRPNSFKSYIGQEKIKDNLKIILAAAKKRNEIPDHLLFYGPPGLGKTTLANLIAKQSTTIDKVEHFLTLDGLCILYKRNASNMRDF